MARRGDPRVNSPARSPPPQPPHAIGVQHQQHESKLYSIYTPLACVNTVPLRFPPSLLSPQVDEDLVAHAARMGDIMRGHMERLAAAHPCVADARNIGLFGAIELRRDVGGTPLTAYGAPPHPVVPRLLAELKARGVWTIASGSLLMCNPPLVITEAEMATAFNAIDGALGLVDAVVAGAAAAERK